MVTVGERMMELVVRTDGQVELYTLAAGPQAVSPDWPVSAQVTMAGGALRITTLHYRPEASRFEGAISGGTPAPGPCRAGYIANGRTEVGAGQIAEVLPPGPPVAALVATAEGAAEEPSAPAADAGASPVPAAEVDPEATPGVEEASATEEVAAHEEVATAEAAASPEPALAAEPAEEAEPAAAARPARRSTRHVGFSSRRRRR
jgi:hypothetical protein